MATGKGHAEARVGVTDFKAKCLALIDAVASGKLDRVVLTKHDKPIASVTALTDEVPELWGALAGTVRIPPGVDLTDPTGEQWDADA